MDALTLLKHDHAEVKELFATFDAAGDRANATRAKTFEKIAAALRAHTTIEEELFYPALKEAAKSKDDRNGVLEAYEEHALAKSLIEEISALDPHDETYVPKVTVLKESIEHHVAEEESELFSFAKSVFDKNELADLGSRMEARKNDVMAPAAR